MTTTAPSRQLRLIVLALVGALLAALAVCASAQAYAEFRTPGEAAYCGRDDGRTVALVCWTPNDGFTVSMGVRGRPRKGYARVNRGYVENSAPLLRFGQVWRGGSFVCRSRSTGLRCVNRRGHGWWIGRYVGYRLF